MVPVLLCIAVVLVLAAMWLASIMVDRHLKRHWEARLDEHYVSLHEGIDPFGPEDQNIVPPIGFDDPIPGEPDPAK